MSKEWRRGLLIVAAFWAACAVVAVWPRERVVKAQAFAPQWTCAADDIGATLTRLKAGGGGECLGALDGQRRYITSIVAQSTTTTSGQWILRYGTGTNCGTGTVSIIPSAATAARIAAPANTAAPTVLPFETPLIVPTGKDICVLGVATNTTTIQVTGYVAP